MGLKGNPVRDGSGPAAVILIPQVGISADTTMPLSRSSGMGRQVEVRKARRPA